MPFLASSTAQPRSALLLALCPSPGSSGRSFTTKLTLPAQQEGCWKLLTLGRHKQIRAFTIPFSKQSYGAKALPRTSPCHSAALTHADGNGGVLQLPLFLSTTGHHSTSTRSPTTTPGGGRTIKTIKIKHNERGKPDAAPAHDRPGSPAGRRTPRKEEMPGLGTTPRAAPLPPARDVARRGWAGAGLKSTEQPPAPWNALGAGGET